MEKKLKLDLLKDTPVLSSEKEYYDFYHKYVSPSLREIIDKKVPIHTIGLFGPWGSGKSTIIKNLKEECSGKYPVFVFDAWKYKGDPLRRTFLIKLFTFIKENHLEKKGNELQDTYLEDLYFTRSESQKFKIPLNIGKSPKWVHKLLEIIKKNLILFLIIGLISSWWLAQINLGDSHPTINWLLQKVGLLAQSTIFYTILIIFAKQAFEWLVNHFLSTFNSEESFYFLNKKKEALNTPEEFERKFQGIIEAIDTRLVIVFDNIDRVQGDKAIDILATIKTFFDPRVDNNVIFIIPCDSDAIEKQIKKYYGESDNFDPSEYLRKLFNVILWTPDFIGTDLEDYSKALIKQLGEDSSLLNTDDVILVINHAFKANPREIKQFINNLVSSLIVASKTEVWDEVKDNVAYLAKTLVLRQKYPDAYKRLKDKWYEPEKIYDNNSEKSLRDFMVNTSTVTAQNAEPFLYFKKPNQTREIDDSEKLATFLVKGDTDQTEKIITKNKNKIDKIADFILSLYSQYRNEPTWIANIFTTHINVFERLKLEVAQARYYDRTLEVIDRYLWQNYKSLPTQQLFSHFVNNTKAKSSLRKTIVNRYVTAIGSKEVIENKAFAKEIIENLIKTEVTVKESLDEFRRSIEGGYSLDPNIMKLFESEGLQSKYITPQALDKFIRSINYDNFQELLPVAVLYKGLIKANNIGGVLVENLNSITRIESSRSPAENPQKRILFETITELVKEPNSLFDPVEAAKNGTLGNNILAAYSNTGIDLEAKDYFIPLMVLVRPQLGTQFILPLDNAVGQFIKNVDVSIFDTKVIPKLKEISKSSEFITMYINYIKERGVSLGGEVLGGLYGNATDREQQDIINALIIQRSDLGLTFIQNLENLPNRQETVVTMLQRLNTVSVASRDPYYAWIASNIKPNDDVAIKQNAVTHITSLLKSDSKIDEEMGYKVLIKSTFLSETSKRDISKGVIEWLRTPGKVVNSNNRFSLKAVAYVFDELQTTLKGDFVFVLFELLDKQIDKPSLEVAIEILNQIRPKWSEFKKDYTDFKEKLTNWTEVANRDYVIEELGKLAPLRPSKEQKNYWNELRKLKKAPVTS